MVDTLSAIIEHRSTESGYHVLRIRGFTRLLLQEVARNHPEYELDDVEIDRISSASALHDIGKNFIDEYPYEIETAGIHSYRYRTKGVSQLLEKVIRKRKENPEKFAHLDHTNFYKYITDLIGIRVFHLYREDWIHFHRYITNRFEININ